MNEHSYYETDGYHIYFQFSMKKNVWPPDGSGADGWLLMADGSWLMAQAHGPWRIRKHDGGKERRKSGWTFHEFLKKEFFHEPSLMNEQPPEDKERPVQG